MKKMLLIVIFALLLLGFGTFVLAADEPVNNGTPLWILEASKCKSVTYTPWQPCLTNFNLQIRYVIQPISGCTVTTQQQVEQIRYCDTEAFFNL